jgi:hypothetical protein
MNSSTMILLFHDPPQLRQNPLSLVFSVLAHGGVITLITLGIIYTPRIQTPRIAERDALRILELHTPPPQPEEIAKIARMRQALLQKHASTARPQPQLEAKGGSASQTFVRPDVPAQKPLAIKIPLPALLLWTHPTDSPRVVPNPPQAQSAELQHASLDMPNQEAKVADQQIASTKLSAQISPLEPARSAPLLLHNPEPQQSIPETPSISDQPPAPTSVLSVSDVKMTDGSVVLPHLNETAGNQDNAGSPASSASASSPANPALLSNAAHSEATSNESAPTATATTSTRHITQAKNGRYNMVTVGNSIEEQYPETADTWAGRLAYTVYLHVGTAHNWILQYALPSTTSSSITGSSAHIDAPWPVDIVVPSLDSTQLSADALLIHGFVSSTGSFEDLSIAYPAQFPLSGFVLQALQQWRFRPSTQNGQAIRTEILLIIPNA